MKPLLTIARNAFVESLRQPIVLVVVLLSGIFQYLNTAMSAYSMGYRTFAGEVTGDNKLLFDIGMGTMFICGILVASFIATAIVSREIENKTVLTVVSKPINRASIVIGKFFGVMGATLLATAIMTCFLLLALRHGVMQNASDDLHMPVIVFGVGAVLLSLTIGAAGNYAYGWPFAQTALLVLAPSIFVAYLAASPFEADWKLAPLTDFVKPEVIKACIASVGALIVLTAIATAASTRLGQVMTIMICLGVFVLGLLSDYFIGRHAFQNNPVGILEFAEPVRPEMLAFDEPGDEFYVYFGAPIDEDIERGDRFFFGPSPNGLGMITPAFDPPPADADLDRDLLPAGTPAAVVVLEATTESLKIKQWGATALPLARPPERGDWVFAEPTRVNWTARTAWSLIPRMHSFWLVDAVTQGRRVPPSHVGLVLLYSLIQATGFLGLAILLFQGRDLG
jgi:ABC-2 type transport system permease protein